jgi:hypothetical protein
MNNRKYGLVLNLICRGAFMAALVSTSAFAADPKPKYGPEATLLSKSHEYIQKHQAPDYWALSPYYVPQKDDRACSVASVAMLVNAARTGRALTADDELATQVDLLKRVKDEHWSQFIDESKGNLYLDDLNPIIAESLKAYGVEPKEIVVVHTDDTSPATAKKLHEALVANEKSDKNFMIINFIQGVYTGDAEAGHIAPIAAYDEARKRVLVLDPDRKWYEPYWVSEATLLKGMATVDKGNGKHRGYVFVQLK